VVGTSSRAPPGKRRLGPAAVAAEALAGAGRGQTALVFGDERSGLTNAELDRCHDVSAVPSDPAQPSLNLAQAVLVYAYELRRATAPGTAPGPGPDGPPGSRPAPGATGPGASDGELRGLEEALRGALRDRGFLAGPERHAVRDLHSTLVRARLSPREVRLWTAALRTLGRRP
jgi:tRNA/rRNA methyltransferase